MAPIIEALNSEQLEARRAELITRAGASPEVLRARRRAYLLDAAGQVLLGDIEDIDFLLRSGHTRRRAD